MPPSAATKRYPERAIVASISYAWGSLPGLPDTAAPTATHDQFVRQSTPPRRDSGAPGAAGVLWLLQEAPFQVCTWGVADDPPPALAPTAVQDVALKQLTPSKMLPGAMVGAGDAGDQLEPFQVTTTLVSESSLPVGSKKPTAMQKLVPTHDTSARYVVPPLALGTAGDIHDVPFQ